MPDTASHRGGRGRGSGGPRGRGRDAAGPSSSTGIPSGSVSKIKAQLRQTKRLLSKPDLNADVKVTSERRLQALEDELVKAEKGLLEKKMVTKYRGIKFFERQKVLRRIKQAKKQLEQDADSTNAKEQLRLARLDLYYILRYPKTEKYLALYPENSYIPYTSTPPNAPSSSTSSPITPSDPSTSSTSLGAVKSKAHENDLKRWNWRSEVLRKVESGEWNPESERGDLAIEGEEDVAGVNAGDHEVIGPSGEPPSRAGDKRSREEEGDSVRGMDEQDDVEEKVTAASKKRKVQVEKREPSGSGKDDRTSEDDKKEGEGEEETKGEAVDGEPKKLNRKQKKALRRAQEAAGIVPTTEPAPASTNTPAGAPMKKQGPAAVPIKKKEEKKQSSSKAEKLAMEDDFFA